MKNKKSLLSVLLAAVLLCACVAGMLIFGASAEGEAVYEISVGSEETYKNVSSALAAIDPAALSGKDRIVITLTSDVEETTSNTLFSAETLALPITVKGEHQITANVQTAGTISSVNDFTFENVTIDTDATLLDLGGKNVEIAGATINTNVALCGSGTISEGTEATLNINSGTISGYVAAVGGDAQLNANATATVNYNGGTVSGLVVGAYGTSHIYGTATVNIYNPLSTHGYGIYDKATVYSGGKVELNVNGGTHGLIKHTSKTEGKYLCVCRGNDFRVLSGGAVSINYNGGTVSGEAAAISSCLGVGGSAFEIGSIMRIGLHGTTFNFTGAAAYYVRSSTLNCHLYLDISDFTAPSGSTIRLIQSSSSDPIVLNGDYYVTIDTTKDGWVEGTGGFTTRDPEEDSEESDPNKSVTIEGTLQEAFGGTFNGNQYTRVNGGSDKTVSIDIFMGAPGKVVDKHFRNCVFESRFGYRRGGTVTTTSLNNYFYQVESNSELEYGFVCAFTNDAGASTTNIDSVTNTFDGFTAKGPVYAGGGSYSKSNSAPYIRILENKFVQTGDTPNTFTKFCAGHINFYTISTGKENIFDHAGTRTDPEIESVTNNIECALTVTDGFYATALGGRRSKTGTITNNIKASLENVIAFYCAGVGHNTYAPTIGTVVNNFISEDLIKFNAFYGGAKNKATITETTTTVNATLEGQTFDCAITSGDFTINDGTFSKSVTGGDITIKNGTFNGTGSITATNLYIYSAGIGIPVSATNSLTLVGGTIVNLFTKEELAAGSGNIVATAVNGDTTIKKGGDGMFRDGNLVLTYPKTAAEKIHVEYNVRGYAVPVDNGNETYTLTWHLVPISAQLVLEERVVIRILMKQSDVEEAIHYRPGTYVWSGFGKQNVEFVPAELPTCEYDGVTYYYFEFDAVGADQFDVVTSKYFTSTISDGATALSITNVATDGINLYGADTPEGKLFQALIDYGKSTQYDPENAETAMREGFYVSQDWSDYAANHTFNKAERTTNTPIEFTNITLLMGDTIGIRLKTAFDNKDDLTNALEGCSFTVNGRDMKGEFKDYYAVSMDDAGANACIDLYVNADDYDATMVIEVKAGEEILLKMSNSVAGILNALNPDAGDNVRLQATAMLMVAAHNYKAAQAA